MDPRPRDDTDAAQDKARELADIAAWIASLKGEASAYLSDLNYATLRLRLENAHAATVDARRRVRMYQEDAWQRSRRKKGPDPRVVKDVSDAVSKGCCYRCCTGSAPVFLPASDWPGDYRAGSLSRATPWRPARLTAPRSACNNMMALRALRDQRLWPRNTEGR